MSSASTATPMHAPAHRYERKFEARAAGYAQLDLLIRMHPGHFREAYPPRHVNNVYFDTPGLTSFHDHVMGASCRSKLRLRWYGDECGHLSKPVLEVKQKVGHVGTKAQFALSPIDFDGTLEVDGLCRNAMAGATSTEVVERLARSRPTLLNRYRRKYYVSGDGRFRITIDMALSFRVINGYHHGFRNRFDARRLIIVELKYGAEHDQDARDIGAGLPFRVSKLSKYIHGLVCLGRFEP